MFKFEQVPKLNNDCETSKKKKTGKFLTVDQVCECHDPQTPCGAHVTGCKLTLRPPKKFPPPREPSIPYEELVQRDKKEDIEKIKEMQGRVFNVFFEKPKSVFVDEIKKRLEETEDKKNKECEMKMKKTRPIRILSNREIMHKIMRRKFLRDRKPGDRLGPYVQVDPDTITSDIFIHCKPDRYKSCILKKRLQMEEKGKEAGNEKKKLVDEYAQTEESYIKDEKDKPKTKEDLENEEFEKLKKVEKEKEEKKKQKKLLRDKSILVLDWNVKPNPCKTLINPDGTCWEKDVNDSEYDSDEEKIECTCKEEFNYCTAFDFLRRRDYAYEWQKPPKCINNEQQTVYDLNKISPMKKN